MMKKPNLLLFDLGGVLIENIGFERLNRLSPPTPENPSVKERWLFSPAVRAFELDQISQEEFARQFIDEWQLPLSPAAFLQEFITWPKDYYPEALETLQTLRRSHRIACLSNSNSLHWEKFGGFAAEFDIALSSHLLGAIKPDSEAFTLALRECDSDPAAIFFYDDSPANVDAARQSGIEAFLVDGFEALRLHLQSQGLLPG